MAQVDVESEREGDMVYCERALYFENFLLSLAMYENTDFL